MDSNCTCLQEMQFVYKVVDKNHNKDNKIVLYEKILKAKFRSNINVQ